MRRIVPSGFILILWSFIFLYGCKKDGAEPDVTAPAALTPLKVLPKTTEVKPYEIIYLIVKEKSLTQKTYPAKLGDLDLSLSRINDTLLVALAPEMPTGGYKLKSTIEGSALDIPFTIKPFTPIANPKEYLQDFTKQSDQEKYKTSLDDLVTKGVITQDQASAKLEAYNQRNLATAQQIANTTPEQLKFAAAFISSNQYLLEEVNESLRGLRKATPIQNGRVQFVDAEVRTKIRQISQAALKIGAMIAAPALLLSEWGPAGTLAGATIGVAIFNNKIAYQKQILENTTIELLNINTIPDMESLKADLRRTMGEETFVNGEARRTDITLKLRNIQPSDATSKIDFIKEFVINYLKLKELWAKYMPDFGLLPEFPALNEKEEKIDYEKVKLEVIENQTKVKGELVKEGEVYKLKFTSTETTDQAFTYRLTYTLPDIDPIKLEKQGKLINKTYTVTAFKGMNQVAGTEKLLRDSLIVRVVDSENKPAIGFSTDWKVISGTGTLFDAATTTDSKGFSRTNFRLGKEEGEYKVEVTVKDKDGKVVQNGIIIFTATAKQTFELKYVLGNAQTGAPNKALANELIVRVVDHNQMPMVGHSVIWRVIEGGGSITTSAATTDANGESLATWTIGASGTQKVEAQYLDKDGKPVPGSPQIFNASIIAVTESFSVKINGVPWEAEYSRSTTAPLVISNGTIQTRSISASNSTPEVNKVASFFIHITPDGLGSYQHFLPGKYEVNFSQAQFTVFYKDASGEFRIKDYNDIINKRLGSVSISSIANGYVEGTFDYTFLDVNENIIFNISEGKFRVKIQN